MPAASSVAAANFLYSQAPRDGTVFGSFSRNIPSQALMRQANLDVDPRRYNWIGGTALPGRVCAAWHTAKVRTPADLLTTELIVGGGGSGSSLSILPTVFNHVLGTKFRLIEGYKGTNDTVIAMERGEVEGVCATYGQFRVHERALKEGKLRLILRAEESPIAAVPEVPSIYDLAKTEEQRQLMRFVFSSVEFGRPYVLPPESPPELVALMRKAFADAVNDGELIAEAERLKLDMTYRPPADLVKLVDNLYGRRRRSSTPSRSSCPTFNNAEAMDSFCRSSPRRRGPSLDQDWIPACAGMSGGWISLITSSWRAAARTARRPAVRGRPRRRP